jgi:hypothetical protein
MPELDYSKYNRMILLFSWRVGPFIYTDNIIGLYFFIESVLKLNNRFGIVQLQLDGLTASKSYTEQ